MNILQIQIAILPIVLILLFIYKKDRNKEPMKLLAKLFIGGILSCFITIFFTYLLENNISYFNNNIFFLNDKDLLINVFIKIALIEELSKWFILFIIAYKSKYFDEKYDMIVYSTCVALGFAAFENILYALTTSIEITFLRAFTAIPLHFVAGLAMAIFLILSKSSKEKILKFIFILLSILIPVLIHGIYDYILII